MKLEKKEIPPHRIYHLKKIIAKMDCIDDTVTHVCFGYLTMPTTYYIDHQSFGSQPSYPIFDVCLSKLVPLVFKLVILVVIL